MKTPPRAQLVIRLAAETNASQALTDLRTAGWDAWECRTPRRNRDDLVIEAWTSRLRGEQFEIADAVAAQAQLILRDFVIISIEVEVHAGRRASLEAWQVQARQSASKDQSKAVRSRAEGHLFFGDRRNAQRWGERLFLGLDMPADHWEITPYRSWSQQMRTAKGALPIAVAFAAAIAGIVAGHLLASLADSNAALATSSLSTMLAGLFLLIAAVVKQARSKPPPPNVTAVTLLCLGITALLCGATLQAMILGTPWVSSIALGGVFIALVIQAAIDSPVFARMRMAPIKIPTAVILAAVGVTLFVLVLNVPVAFFYNSAGAFQLVGKASWGVVIGTGLPFSAAVALVAFFAWVALHRWRHFTTLFRPRLLFGLLATGLFIFIAASFLGHSISDGQLARRGEFGADGLTEYMMPVCIEDPRTIADRTPLWLLGTDGETTVLLDRSKMTGRKAAVDFPHYLDADRELAYVNIDEGC